MVPVAVANEQVADETEKAGAVLHAPDVAHAETPCACEPTLRDDEPPVGGEGIGGVDDALHLHHSEGHGDYGQKDGSALPLPEEAEGGNACNEGAGKGMPRHPAVEDTVHRVQNYKI